MRDIKKVAKRILGEDTTHLSASIVSIEEDIVKARVLSSKGGAHIYVGNVRDCFGDSEWKVFSAVLDSGEVIEGQTLYAVVVLSGARHLAMSKWEFTHELALMSSGVVMDIRRGDTVHPPLGYGSSIESEDYNCFVPGDRDRAVKELKKSPWFSAV